MLKILFVVSYSQQMQDFDGSAKAAQAMGAVAAAFGGILWAGCIFMLFFKFPAWLFKTIGGVFIFCFATQMLTLLILNESLCNGEDADAAKIVDPAFQCNLGSDGATSIAAAIFYLGIGITILVCPVPKTAVLTCFGGCCKNICGEDEEACGCCSEDATLGAVIETAGTPGGGNISSIGAAGHHIAVQLVHSAVGTAADGVVQHIAEVAAAGCNLDLVAATEHIADHLVLDAAVPSLADYLPDS